VSVRRLFVALVVVALALAAARMGGAAEPVRVTALLAIGDFGVGGERQRAVGASMRRFEALNPADRLVTLGDNDYTENPAAFRANWGDSFGWLASAGVGVAGALGNHDIRVEGGRYQFGPLQMPGPTYRRKVGLVELFVLNSNDVNHAQRNWLERALRTSRAPWKVAVFHHPAYTCGGYFSNRHVVRLWLPLFERYGVQLVLSGHDHNYQRFVPRRGVTYLVHGGGGAESYPIKPCPRSYPRRARARREHGWLYVRFGQDRAVGWAVNVSGRRTDRFTVRR
jgi:3',5'-cyclic AMP phosphodiesterase CpdA